MTLISAEKRSELWQSFVKDAEVAFIEANRSIVQTSTSIPTWVIVLLIVLGWNELMAVLSNPLYFIIVSFGLIVFYVAHSLGMVSTTSGVFSTGLFFVFSRLLDLLKNLTNDGQGIRHDPDFNIARTKAVASSSSHHVRRKKFAGEGQPGEML